MSQGILQHAVTGRVPLQLTYTNVGTDPQHFQADDDHASSQVNQSLDEEFACLLELI